MLLEVHYNGNEFVAYNKNTNQKITDRNILESLSFTQFPGVKGVFEIEVDIAENSAIMKPLQINIGIQDT